MVVSFPVGTTQVSRSEQDIELSIIEGNLPQALTGHVFVMGATGPTTSPSQTVFPGGDGTSLFNGDGMIYRLSFAEGKALWRSRLIKTPCFYADRGSAPGTIYSNLGFSNHGLSRLSLTLGSRNQLNTAAIPIKFAGDEAWRLMVTWDAGRPYEIDPETLELITPIGGNDEWYSPKLPLGLNDTPFPMLLTGAHPGYDPHSQELFMVNWAISFVFLFGSLIVYNLTNTLPWGIRQFCAWLLKLILTPISNLLDRILPPDYTGFADLLKWDGKGKLQRWKIIDQGGKPIKIRQSLHQIAVTQDYIVLMDTAFKIGLEQLLNYPSRRNLNLDQKLRDVIDEPQLSVTPLYIVKRSELTPDRITATATLVTIERESAHFLANYSNPDGKITIHLAHNNAWDPSEWLRDWDVSLSSNPVPHSLSGVVVGTTDLNSLGRYEIDVKEGKVVNSQLVRDENLTWAPSIYAYDGMLTIPDQIDRVFWICWGCWGELTTEYLLDMYRNYPYREKSIKSVKEIAKKGVQVSICALDTRRELTIKDSFIFPAGYFVSSPQYISPGYILVVVNHGPSDLKPPSEIWIFNSDELRAGPICKLSNPLLNLGITIHSTYLPELGKRNSNYHIPVRADYAGRVSQSSPLIQDFFNQVVYPNFE